MICNAHVFSLQNCQIGMPVCIQNICNTNTSKTGWHLRVWCCIIFSVEQTEKKQNGQTFEMVTKCPFLFIEGFISIGIWSLSSILGVNWLIYWQILCLFTLSLKLVSKQTLTNDFILILWKTPLHLNISKLTDRS